MRFLRSVVVVLLASTAVHAANPERPVTMIEPFAPTGRGLELPYEAAQTPTALGELVRSEIDRWVPIIKKAGVVVQ